MRVAVCAVSAVLLSGCSWFGGNGQPNMAYSQKYAYKSQAQGQYGYGAPNRCQVYSPTQPVPQGCDAAAVTVAAGGFPQQPDFNAGYGYTTGSYGSHASTAGQYDAGAASKPRLRKPKLRGSLSLGLEKSNSGTLLDYAMVPGINPELTYNPNDYAEGTTSGSVSSGTVTQTLYTGTVEKIRKPSLSYGDVYSTPTRVAAGLEFIASPKFTVFANGGYSHAQGEEGEAVEVQATLLKTVSTQQYDTTAPYPAVGAPIVNTSFIPNATIAKYNYNFNDMERYDLEVGGRYYFDPIVKDQSHRTLTPFVGASVGASHYNETKFEVTQSQLFYQRAFDSNLATQDFYEVVQPATNVQLYDAQWVPTGALTAGMEWQVTPKAAFALETGVKFEAARDYSNGNQGENNIAVPVTLRGSFNF